LFSSKRKKKNQHNLTRKRKKKTKAPPRREQIPVHSLPNYLTAQFGEFVPPPNGDIVRFEKKRREKEQHVRDAMANSIYANADVTGISGRKRKKGTGCPVP